MTTSSLGDINPQPGVVPIDPSNPDLGTQTDASTGYTGRLHATTLEERLEEIDRKRKLTGIGAMEAPGIPISDVEYPLARNVFHAPQHKSPQGPPKK